MRSVRRTTITSLTNELAHFKELSNFNIVGNTVLDCKYKNMDVQKSMRYGFTKK